MAAVSAAFGQSIMHEIAELMVARRQANENQHGQN
jgi:hypothetical protein